MSLYTCIYDDSGELIVLNSKYTKEQLREKLLPTDYSEVKHILDTGTYLTEPLVKKIYAKYDIAYVTTQEKGREVKLKETRTIVVYPDGSWRDATFLEKLTQEVDDGMWGSVLYTKIAFKNNEVMFIFGQDYEKYEIKEQLSQKYSDYAVNQIIHYLGRYIESPRLIKISANKKEDILIEQYLEGFGSKIRHLKRTRSIVIYPNGFWRFATFKEVTSGEVLY